MAYIYAVRNARRGQFRSRPTLHDMSDDEIMKITRFPRSMVEDICVLLDDDLERVTRRSNALSVESQVVSALQFFASGSFQWMVGRSSYLSQPSTSRAVARVTETLCRLAPDYIRFPTGLQDIIRTKQSFNGIAGFPNVIGAIDCTHIAIKAPRDGEDAYVNRKGVHTLNIQAVCDAEMRIVDVVAKWPGASHDSFIWRSSGLHTLFESGRIADGWLLGKYL